MYTSRNRTLMLVIFRVDEVVFDDNGWFFSSSLGFLFSSFLSSFLFFFCIYSIKNISNYQNHKYLSFCVRSQQTQWKSDDNPISVTSCTHVRI